MPRAGARAPSVLYYVRYNKWGFPMHSLKITQIGNSLGLILPREVLARLKLAKGDVVHITESPDGLRLTPNDPDFEAQMALARGIMKKRRAVLRELAK